MKQKRTVANRGLLSLVVVFFCAGWAATAGAACNSLSIEDAWVRSAPPGVPMAGYFRVTNTGDARIKLTDASSTAFERVEMHQSMVKDSGMATMKPVASIALAPGESVAFEPGGYHLMMFEPEEMLMPGDSVKLTLHCGNEQTAVTAEVRKLLHKDAGASGRDEMNHDDMSQGD